MKRVFKTVWVLLFISILAGSSVILSSCTQVEQSKGWDLSTPEEQGMDSQKLSQMFKFIGDSTFSIHNLLIVRNGKLVVDANFYPYQKNVKHTLDFCTESVTSALIGIALEEGKIKSIDEKVMDILKIKDFENVDVKKKNISIKQLLTMTSNIQPKEYWEFGHECYQSLDRNGKKSKTLIGLDDIYRISNQKESGLLLAANNKVAQKGYWLDSKTFVIISKSLSGEDELEYYYTFENDEVEVYTSSKFYNSSYRNLKGKFKK
ncbi:MAG: serine hydrolase [Clostridia bacterium]|nr:serine hydrolase [Clostridia bacterium]